MYKRKMVVLLWLCCVFTVATSCAAVRPHPDTPVLQYRVVQSYPHDNQAKTQGLIIHDGVFYESTGGYGRSTLRKVIPATGMVSRSLSLNAGYFGEGLAGDGRRLYQLTWKAGKGFVYDMDSFKRLKVFQYEGEGWGLAYDGKHLIMSDGTSVLRLLDPRTWQVVGRQAVTDHGRPVIRLNELEYIKGEIWANIFQTSWIVRISPQDGKVLAWIDMSRLDPGRPVDPREDVLNGIAYDPDKDHIFVTGKRWAKTYRIQLQRP